MRLPQSPIRAVVFDHDGTMFNTEALYQQVGTELLRRRGKLFTAELLDQMMGRPPAISLRLMIEYHGLTDTPAQLSLETDEIFHELLETRLEMMPGIPELMDELERHRIPKAIATSSGPVFVGKCLGKFELVTRFDFVLTHQDVDQGKPHPEIYEKAAARLQVAPAEMLVLEDSAVGCRAAVDSGAYVVAVPGGHSHTHDFSGAAFIAESAGDRRIRQALGWE
ncbi:MAG: HAD family phosphatase [Pirellulales bacterium]